MAKMLLALVVLVAFQMIAYAQIQPITMTDSYRLQALNAHNDKRKTVANGQAVNKNGSTLPFAGDMYQLSYSKMVEVYAQDLAKTCVMQHNSVNGTSNNLYATASTAGYMEPGKALQAAVSAWYGELASGGQSSLKLDSTNYNHFTQVVWAKTKEIGCGVANCPSLNGAAPNSFKWTYVVCDYSPAGNYLNQNIYTASTAAGNKCPSGSTVNSSKLCQINNVADIHA